MVEQTIYSWQDSLKRRSILVMIFEFSILYFLALFLSYIFFSDITVSSIIALIISLSITGFMTYTSLNDPTYFIDLALPVTEANPNDPLGKRALEIVDKLKIATGVHNVKVKIVNWDVINAFVVAGRDTNYLYFTKGALKKLDDYELEAVTAHEFSHMIHKDGYYMTLGAIIGGAIVLLAYFLFRVVPTLVSDRERGNSFLIAIAAYIIGLILYLFTPYIVEYLLAYFSRQREYLADSYAVYITKNPGAMIRALVKVALEDTSKLVKGNDVPHNITLLFFDYEDLRTHPPVWKRIEAISKTTGYPVDPKLIEELKKREI